MAAPKVYLSPAMHMANPCVYPRADGKQCYEALENNEYIDILEPILNRCGIETKRGYRRTPMSNENGNEIMKQNVRESNAWGADVHYVSHTNATEKHNATGCHPMYYTYSSKGKKLGQIMVKYRKQIYPGTVRLIPRSDLYELRVPNAVSFYEEHAFHDVLSDITWFHEHMTEIAESAAQGLCEWFGIPYIAPSVPTVDPVPTPTLDEYSATFSMLQYGNKGNEVRLLQEILVGKGYSLYPYGADGDFGKTTKDALIKFQKANSAAYGLAWDGICGPKTWKALLRK